MDSDNKLDTTMPDPDEDKKITPPRGRTIIAPKIPVEKKEKEQPPKTNNSDKVKKEDRET